MINVSRVLAMAVLAAAVSAPPAAAQTEVTERFSKTAHLDQSGAFDLSNIAGTIVVTGGGGRDVTIEAIKRVQRPNPNAARTLLGMIDIEVVEQANRVEVRTMYPRPRNFPGSVDYTVSVPEDATVTIRTMSGDIRVTRIGGELRAQTVTGNVVAVATRRLGMLRSVSGNIEITDAAADDSAVAQTVNGSITVRGLKARAVQLGVVSGNIHVESAQTTRMTAKAVSGDVEYAGELVRNGQYEFTSHSGDVRLMLAGSTGFELRASTFSGTVQSDFAVDRRGEDAPGRRGQAAVGSGRAIRGAFGDASAMLALRAFSGNISITRR